MCRYGPVNISLPKLTGQRGLFTERRIAGIEKAMPDTNISIRGVSIQILYNWAISDGFGVVRYSQHRACISNDVHGTQ